MKRWAIAIVVCMGAAFVIQDVLTRIMADWNELRDIIGVSGLAALAWDTLIYTPMTDWAKRGRYVR